MTDDRERRRRIERWKDELRLQRKLQEEGRKLSADPKWQALQEHLLQLQSDPEWQRQQENLNEAVRELAREEAEEAKQPEPSPESISGSLAAGEAADIASLAASSGSRGVLDVGEGADTAAASGLVRTIGDLTAAEAADTAAFAQPPEPTPPSQLSKAEGDDVIRRVYRDIYDEAWKQPDKKPPNGKEVGIMAKPRLEKLGVQHLTQARLHKIAMEREFQNRRQPPGVRWTKA